MTTKNHLIKALFSLALATSLTSSALAARHDEVSMPDFTNGGTIPADAAHDWNLGATGLRGWIYCDQMVTSDARQIAITQVDKKSPAGKVFDVAT
jgi:hypothetical protein